MTHRIKDEDIDAASPHQAIIAHRARELAQSKSPEDRQLADHLAARFKDAHAASFEEKKRVKREIADRGKLAKQGPGK